MKKRFLLSLLFFSFVLLLHGENFRVYRTHVVDLSDTESNIYKVSAGVSDAVVVKLPRDLLFWQGIAFEVKIPQIVASYTDSVAYSVYKNISPEPKAGVMDYSGQRLGIDTFHPRLSYNIKVPLVTDHKMKASPYSVLLEPILENNGLLFLRLQQVMKGTPAQFFEARFDISVQPVFYDKGMLHIDVVKPEGIEGSYNIFIDEKEVFDFQRGILLPSGLHHISIVSDAFRNEVRTVNLEKACHTNLVVELKDIAPTIQVIAPENTIVELDGVVLENPSNQIVVTEGEHVVKMIVGNYETIRTVLAQKGKTYTLSLSVDVKIVEE